MNLKITVLASTLAIACGALTLAPAAHAVTSPSGTINFNARVVANSCVIAVTGGSASTAGAAGNGAVTLPTVYTTDFSGAGSVTGR